MGKETKIIIHLKLRKLLYTIFVTTFLIILNAVASFAYPTHSDSSFQGYVTFRGNQAIPQGMFIRVFCNSTGTTAFNLHGQNGVYVSDWYNGSWNNTHEWTYYVDIPAGSTYQRIYVCGYGQACERWEIHGGTGQTSPSSQLIINPATSNIGTVVRWSNLVPHVHHYDKQITDSFPTCTNTGRGHYVCPDDNARGSDYTISALGHSYGSWSSWSVASNTEMKRTRKCSRCGAVQEDRMKRTYWVNISVLCPENIEHTKTGNGYFKISNDGVNWSNMFLNQPDSYSYIGAAEYGQHVYIRYVKTAKPSLEFKSIKATHNCTMTNLQTAGDIYHSLTGGSDLQKISDNTWMYTVTNDSDNGSVGQCIHIYMDYKHTTLTLDPNGGFVDNTASKVALDPKMQYMSGNWWNLSAHMPTRPGYTFLGWYDKATGGTLVYDSSGNCIRGTAYFDSNGHSICTDDLTVYAHWQMNTRTITFDANAPDVKNPEPVDRYYGSIVGNGNPNLIESVGLFPNRLIANGANVQNGTGVKAEIITDGTENTVKMTLLEDLKDKNYVIGGYYTHNQISGLTLGKKYTFAIQAKGTGEWAVGHERVSIKVEKLTGEYNTYHSTSTAINNKFATVILYANTGKTGEWIQYKMPTLQEGEATLPELTRTGYKFLGWYTERTGGRKIDPYEFVTGDTTYYAHWEAIPYKITTVLFSGTVSGMPKTYTIEDDFILPKPSLLGYRFLGWTMTCKAGLTNTNGSITKIDTFSPVESLHIQRGTIGDIVLTANYSKISSASGNDNEHNKTPDDNGENNHITDTGERKNPIIVEGSTKHNKFTVMQK